MSDPIRNYLDSVANLEHVSANAKRMISVVLNVAAALQRNPLGVMFSNTVTGMPMSVGTERPIANASDWPYSRANTAGAGPLASCEIANITSMECYIAKRPE